MWVDPYTRLSPQIYKMTTELQTFFESQVLSFLVSCKPGGQDGGTSTLHATRGVVDRLASATSLTRDAASPANMEPVSNELNEDSESEEDLTSLELLTRPATPASETSVRETRSMRRARNQSDGFGMMLRTRERRKRILEDSESEGDQGREEDGEEGEGVSLRRGTRTRTPRKRCRRVSSESRSDSKSIPLSLLQAIVTTSRGRIVKPTSKFRGNV